MSQENVELVVSLQPAQDVDIAHVFRDDAIVEALATTLVPMLHSRFEAVAVDALRGETTHRGFHGLRELWLDWLSPWEAYRTELEEARDLGDRVLLLVHDFGRREGSTQEVVLNGAALWTLRDGKIPALSSTTTAWPLSQPQGWRSRRCRRTWRSFVNLWTPPVLGVRPEQVVHAVDGCFSPDGLMSSSMVVGP